MKILQAITDLLIIMKYHLESSFRYILIASIGLIIALSILSSSILFINSQKGVILEDVFDDVSTSLTITHDRSFNSTKDDLVSQLTNETLEQFDLINKVENYIDYTQTRYTVNSEKTWLQSNFSNNEVNVIELSRIDYYPYIEIFADYWVPNSKIEQNSENNQKVFLLFNMDDIKPSSWIPQIDDEFEFIFQYFSAGLHFEHLNNLTISGIIKINSTQLQKLSEQEPILALTDFARFRGNALFVSNLTALHYNKEDENASFYKYINFRDFTIHVFDIQAFNGFETEKTVDTLEIMKLQLRNTLWNEGIYETKIRDNILGRLRLIEEETAILYNNILLFALPVILVAVTVAYYSFGLIRRQKLQILSIYLSHGISRIQYLSFIIFEMILSLVIAIIIGIIVSIPITVLIIRSSGFIEFNAPIYFSTQLLTVELVQILAQYGIILAFLINVLQIMNYLTFSIKDAERESVEERENPFWKRKFLDVIFLSFGLTFYLITAYSIDLGSIIPGEMLSLLSLPSPLLIIFGAVMLIARLFPYLTQILSTYLWEKRGSLLSFSLKNITLRRYSTTRALILISLSFAFMISFISFPYSFISHEETKLHYNIGSDISVNLNFKDLNYTRFDEIFENYTEHIESYTPVLKANLMNNPIMVVNYSSFSKSSWMKPDYTDDLENTLNRLSLDNSSILIYEGNLQALEGKIDDLFVWKNSEETESNENPSVFSFTTRGTFKLWPNLLNTLPNNPRSQLFGVMSFETFNNTSYQLGDLSNNLITNQLLELYVKPKFSLNQTAFKLDLKTLSDISSIELYSQERDYLFNNALYFSLIGQINSDILYTLSTIIIVILMFGFMQVVERSREIATERSFGMMINQNFFIIFSESIWLLFIGITAGIVLGYFFSSLFLLSVALGTGFPPFVMIYPMEFIFGFVILIIGISIIFSLMPAYFSTKIDITKLLRVE